MLHPKNMGTGGSIISPYITIQILILFSALITIDNDISQNSD
jgi:hypothetical protein